MRDLRRPRIPDWGPRPFVSLLVHETRNGGSMTFDLDALQAAAEAAAPGPWAWTSGLESEEASLEAATSEGYVLSAYGLHTEGFLAVEAADAEFIAAANPAVVLELVAAHRAALARIARVEALHHRMHTFGNDEFGAFKRELRRALTEGEPDAQV